MSAERPWRWVEPLPRFTNERIAQGLSPTITDPAVIAKIAARIRESEAEHCTLPTGSARRKTA